MTRAILRKVAVVVLVLASLFSAFRYWRSMIGVDRDAARISAWEARMAEARDDLPIERGVVGYVGEWDVPGFNYAYWDQEGEYMLAQYALAPLILKRGPVAEWNVAVLSQEALAAWQAAHGDEFEILPVERNVYILHRLDGQ